MERVTPGWYGWGEGKRKGEVRRKSEEVDEWEMRNGEWVTLTLSNIRSFTL